MTNEEIERAIEIILNNQATFETQLVQTNAQIGKTNAQLAETNKIVGALADSQNELTGLVTAHVTAQNAFNAEIKTSITQLAETVERFIKASQNGGKP